ncbi:hypothetical protein EUGRSUZ_E01153 [Eucalyptus grandis]|uniref:Uncharacterized protein n=2 Tax=Eucalyptus grandis TaxID=71139 RepID=A0ACC3KUE5_EUCGR|nr:hypothetical protein EUGRSUZ_E01153 [Eucalyptus grandis]
MSCAGNGFGIESNNDLLEKERASAQPKLFHEAGEIHLTLGGLCERERERQSERETEISRLNQKKSDAFSRECDGATVSMLCN